MLDKGNKNGLESETTIAFNRFSVPVNRSLLFLLTIALLAGFGVVVLTIHALKEGQGRGHRATSTANSAPRRIIKRAGLCEYGQQHFALGQMSEVKTYTWLETKLCP